MKTTLTFLSPLHRCAEKKYPQDLPSISVILIYLNEALSIMKRAIRSIIDKTPARLLKEIILVDDHSTNGKFSLPFKTKLLDIFRGSTIQLFKSYVLINKCILQVLIKFIRLAVMD